MDAADAEAAAGQDGGGVLVGDGRAVTIKDSIKDLSKLTLFFLLIFDGGYLSGEAAADRDGGGVLVIVCAVEADPE